MVWHGSNASGHRVVDKTCDNWDDWTSNKMGIASDLYGYRLLHGREYTCKNAFILLCIEITSRTDIRR